MIEICGKLFMQKDLIRIIFLGIVPIPYIIMMLLLRFQWYPRSHSIRLKKAFDYFSMINAVLVEARCFLWICDLDFYLHYGLIINIVIFSIALVDSFFTCVYVAQEIS